MADQPQVVRDEEQRQAQALPEVHDQGFDPILYKEPIKDGPFAAIPQDQALLSTSQLAGVEDGIRLTNKVVYQWIA